MQASAASSQTDDKLLSFIFWWHEWRAGDDEDENFYFLINMLRQHYMRLMQSGRSSGGCWHCSETLCRLGPPMKARTGQPEYPSKRF